MFDRIVIGSDRPQRVHEERTITVHEHRAPTDDSIRLYKEMLEKAHKEILYSIEIQDNALNINAIVVAPPDTRAAWKCLYHMTLNGRDIDGELKLGYNELRGIERHEITQKLLEEASLYIAAELVRQIIPQVPR